MGHSSYSALKKRPYRPTIISTAEVQKIIDCIPNLKYKAIISTAYSSGLRISEVIKLQIQDIDSKRMCIFVREGKGGKSRLTILSSKNLELLRQYWIISKPKTWLFPSTQKDKPISDGSVQQEFYRARIRAGISPKVSFHSLRHSFATHLLDSGTSLVHIKDILGHTDIRTTSQYLHLSTQSILNIKSPFDTWGGKY